VMLLHREAVGRACLTFLHLCQAPRISPSKRPQRHFLRERLLRDLIRPLLAFPAVPFLSLCLDHLFPFPHPRYHPPPMSFFLSMQIHLWRLRSSFGPGPLGRPPPPSSWRWLSFLISQCHLESSLVWGWVNPKLVFFFSA